MADRRRSDDDDPEGERLAAELRRELRHAPPPASDLVDRVMREVAARPRPVARRGFWAWLWRPFSIARVATLRPATALVLVAAIAGVSLVGLARRQTTVEVTPLQAVTPPPAPSPATGTPVHFAMVAPGARVVAVAGDFNNWKPEGLTAGPEGWVLDRPVPRGDWRYAFVVDGKWVEDPAAARYSPDGFGGRNAVLRL